MKIRLLSLIGISVLAACSSPKLTYKFDYHDYNAGRKIKKEVATNPGPVAIQPELLVAGNSEVVESGSSVLPDNTGDGGKVNTPLTLSKTERKELKKDLNRELRKMDKKKDGIKAVESAKAIDKDLKLAAIFGAVGIVGLILPAPIFWIGAVALLIGVVFFVRWLLRQ